MFEDKHLSIYYTVETSIRAYIDMKRTKYEVNIVNLPDKHNSTPYN